MPDGGCIIIIQLRTSYNHIINMCSFVSTFEISHLQLVKIYYNNSIWYNTIPLLPIFYSPCTETLFCLFNTCSLFVNLAPIRSYRSYRSQCHLDIYRIVCYWVEFFVCLCRVFVNLSSLRICT